MINFSYYSPTKILFGKDTDKKVGKEVSGFGKKFVSLRGREYKKNRTL